MGSPIAVEKLSKDEIAEGRVDERVDKLHEKFVAEMIRLFERTKLRHGCTQADSLEIYG